MTTAVLGAAPLVRGRRRQLVLVTAALAVLAFGLLVLTILVQR